MTRQQEIQVAHLSPKRELFSGRLKFPLGRSSTRRGLSGRWAETTTAEIHACTPSLWYMLMSEISKIFTWEINESRVWVLCWINSAVGSKVGADAEIALVHSKSHELDLRSPELQWPEWYPPDQWPWITLSMKNTSAASNSFYKGPFLHKQQHQN